MRAWLERQRTAVFALLAYSAVTAVYLRALLAHVADQVLDNGDVVFNLTVVSWVADRVPHAFARVWDAPWFFPSRHALALSDHLLGPGVVLAALRPLVGGEIAAYNLILSGAFVLSGWTVFLLLRRLGCEPLAAFVGGAIWTFQPFRWDEINHLQVLLTAAIPLLLWSFHRLLAAPTWPRAVAFLLVYALHLSGGTYLAVMVHVPLVVLLFTASLGLWRRRWEAAAAGILIATLAVSLALGAALFVPYRTGSEQVRTEADFRTWGATTLSLLQPSTASSYGGAFPAPFRRPENALFPGIVASLLLGVRFFWPGRDLDGRLPGGTPRRRWLELLGAVLLAVGLALGDLRTWSGLAKAKLLGATVSLEAYRRPGLLLLLGCVLLLVANSSRIRRAREASPLEVDLSLASAAALLCALPAVFAAAASHLPGFAGMRVPTRFYVFASLGLALGAARGFERLQCWASARRASSYLPAIVLAALLVESLPVGLGLQRLTPRSAPSASAQWLRLHDEVRAVVYLPLADAASLDREISRMWEALAHGRPIANGYSGTFPASYRALLRGFWSMPPIDEPKTLAEAGITHVVVDWNEVEPARQSLAYHWFADRETEGALRVVFEQDGVVIYELRAESRAG